MYIYGSYICSKSMRAVCNKLTAHRTTVKERNEILADDIKVDKFHTLHARYFKYS